MEIPHQPFAYDWLKFRGMPQHDFKQESKFGDKDCCAEKHRKPHKGRLDIDA